MQSIKNNKLTDFFIESKGEELANVHHLVRAEAVTNLSDFMKGEIDVLHKRIDALTEKGNNETDAIGLTAIERLCKKK